MKRTASLFILHLFLFLQVFSQDIQLGYANEMTNDGLKEHLSVLASGDMEGRKSGTPGQRKAAEYITKQFREIGLMSPPGLSGYSQYFSFPTTGYIPTSFKVGKSRFQNGKDYLLLDDGNDKEGGFKANQIIFAGYGISDKNYDDYANKKIAGKVVVLFPGEPKENGNFLISGTDELSKWGKSLTEKIILAKEKGAIAVLVINPSDDIFLSSGSALPKKEAPLIKPDLTVIRIVPQMMEQILGEIETQELIELHRQDAPLNNIIIEKTDKIKMNYGLKEIMATTSNIIGMIMGSDKMEEYLVLSAHYDHLGKEGKDIFYGADDNGSGTSALLEMARSFVQAKKEGHGPRRSIVFVAFSGEEQGLYGSSYFTQFPIFPLDSITVNLNTDMVGRWDRKRSKDYVYVVGDDQLSSELKPLSSEVNEKYTKLELDYKYNDPTDPELIFYRSDHYNFAKKGVPIIFFTNGVHPDYHQSSDTVDKIDFDLLKKRAQFIFLTAWEIANRENMLKRDLPLRRAPF